MTSEQFSQAMQYLDDDLLLEANALRGQKQGGLPMKKKMTVLLAAVLITVLSCVTAFAAVSGGWFADVKNAAGAVTGTEYCNATEEIAVTAAAGGELLTVYVSFNEPAEFPYREIEMLRVGSYTVTDHSGRTVLQGVETEAVPVENGAVQVSVPVGELTAGEYTLHITSFIGEKKAEQPLPVYGQWDIGFTME